MSKVPPKDGEPIRLSSLAPIDEIVASMQAPGRLLSWERERIRFEIPKLIKELMSFVAESSWESVFMDACERYYSHEEVWESYEDDFLTYESERVAFYPWYLWDFSPDAYYLDEPTSDYLDSLPKDENAALPWGLAGTKFYRHGGLNTYQRELAKILLKSRLGFFEVLSISSHRYEARLKDIANDKVWTIRDRHLIPSLRLGHILAARAIFVTEDALKALDAGDEAFLLVDTFYGLLAAEKKDCILRALSPAIGQSNALLDRYIKWATPRLMRLINAFLEELQESLHDDNIKIILSSLRDFRDDDDALLLCESMLAYGSEEDALKSIRWRTSPFVLERGVYVWREEPTGTVMLIEKDGRLKVMANTRAAYRRAKRWFRTRAKRFQLLPVYLMLDIEELPYRLFGSSAISPWLWDLDVQRELDEAITAWLSQWPELPNYQRKEESPATQIKHAEGLAEIKEDIETLVFLFPEKASHLVEWLNNKLLELNGENARNSKERS